MSKFVFSFILFFLSIIVSGQTRTISGIIIDSPTTEPLSGAHISVFNPADGHLLGQTTSGNTGNFIISGLPAADVRVLISHVGYKIFKEKFDLKETGMTGLHVVLENSQVQVGEVIVTALRKDMKWRDVSLPLSVVTENQIRKNPGITTSDILKNEPGISIARDGIWATSLNIRGLTEQRILTLVDGSRIETATDLAAGISMIDVNDIERVEVIKGAASSLYGTGAMGGVVNIITKNGYYNDNFYAGGSLSGTYMTVNRMHAENISVRLGDSVWYVYAGGTYRKALNTMTPEGELLNSQFKDQNIILKAAVKPFRNHELKFNYQRFTARDVGIPGGSAFPVNASATYSLAQREMFSAAYRINDFSNNIDGIEIKVFHQNIVRDVLLIPNPSVTITPSGFHNTNGVQAQGKLNLAKNNVLIAGIDIWQRHLKTEREKLSKQVIKDSLGNIISTDYITRGEIPIPDSRFTSGGLFFQEQVGLFNNKLEINIGGRFDLIHVINKKSVDPLYLVINDVRNDKPADQRISFEAGNVNNISWSTDVGILFHALPDADLTFTASKAFRSPSLEERFKYIDLGTIVKIGDPYLLPEDGYFLDAGARIWKDRLHFSTNLFINSMRNLIVEIPGFTYYNYSDQPGRTDTIPALINSNVTRALLYGFDMIANYNFYGGLTIISSVSFVRGKDINNNTDLPQIPPFGGRLGIRYNLPGWFGIEVYSNMVADQDRIAEGELLSKGYATYDLNVFSTPIKFGPANLTVFGGIENITDRAYMNHLATNRGSIKQEPGRNFFIRMRMEF